MQQLKLNGMLQDGWLYWGQSIQQEGYYEEEGEWRRVKEIDQKRMDKGEQGEALRHGDSTPPHPAWHTCLIPDGHVHSSGREPLHSFSVPAGHRGSPANNQYLKIITNRVFPYCCIDVCCNKEIGNRNNIVVRAVVLYIQKVSLSEDVISISTISFFLFVFFSIK